MLSSKGPTGWEVARAANVSQSTVSLVLSGRAEGRVSAATQERVRRVAGELGYRPHAAARSLRLGRSGLVLIVLPSVRDPFFASVLDGATQAAQDHGCSVVVASTQHGLINGATNAVDGAIVCAKPPLELTAYGRQLPMVVLDAAAPRGVPTVRLDAGDGLTQAVRRLLELGHRRIGYLQAPRGHGFQARWTAFKRLAAEVDTVSATVVTAELTAAAVERGATRLLGAPGGPVTAIVCDHDVQAAGVYLAAERAGLRIPADLSVVAFGSSGLATVLRPALTSIELSGAELGRTGLLTLLGLLSGRVSTSRAVLPTRLVERESTAVAATALRSDGT